jgi:hypothetical protein
MGMTFTSNKTKISVQSPPAPGVYYIDFTTAAAQDPLSDGGIWTNNSQGTGGNSACVDKANMRVALAKDGMTRIAQHAFAPVSGYNDSFAFVPGISAAGNIRVTVTIYRHPNYMPETPPDNHELEIILGCKVPGANNSTWIECLLNNNGGGSSDVILLDGVNSNFQFIGQVLGNIPAPYDGMMWRAELDRSTDPHRVRWGWSDDSGATWNLGCDTLGRPNAHLITNLGDGAGIASYRTSFGGSPPSESGGMGFRDFRAESYSGAGTDWK